MSKGPDLGYSPRRPWDDEDPSGYLESDIDFLHNNLELAVFLLEKFGPDYEKDTSNSTAVSSSM